MVFGYLGADGWQSVGEWTSGYERWTGPGELLVSDRGEVWSGVQHFVDGAWRTHDGDGSPGAGWGTAVGADGTLWGMMSSAAFFRFDGTEWTTFGRPDWMPRSYAYPWGELHVAPDGFLWVPPLECDQGINGVARFDGETWTRSLQGYCVEAMDIAADGSVWTLATESGADLRHVYVITPEAVAVAE
jgi:hypothetical protein